MPPNVDLPGLSYLLDLSTGITSSARPPCVWTASLLSSSTSSLPLSDYTGVALGTSHCLLPLLLKGQPWEGRGAPLLFIALFLDKHLKGR